VGGTTRGRATVVAIDGPAGSGKSTLATRLAVALGLPYVNTGLMYRALTDRALRIGVPPGDGPRLAELVRGMRFDLTWSTRPPSLEIDGRPPSPALSAPEVERTVSEVSRHPEVRLLMRDAQRRLGEGGAVMEGRDIGSVIFPEAPVKIFLVAEPSERVARRRRERRAGGEGPPPGGIAEDLAARDQKDAQVNPFVPAPDALLIDTTGKDADQVFEEALAAVRSRLGDRR